VHEPVDPLAADDERPDTGRGDPVMATDATTTGQPTSRWFEPPEPPPPSADRLTIDAYELEQIAYERELQRR
jgi:hypothetical protein